MTATQVILAALSTIALLGGSGGLLTVLAKRRPSRNAELADLSEQHRKDREEWRAERRAFTEERQAWALERREWAEERDMMEKRHAREVDELRGELDALREQIGHRP